MTSPRSPYNSPSQAGMVSLSIHAGVIGLLLLASGQMKTTVPQMIFNQAPLMAPTVYRPVLRTSPAGASAGGGGGMQKLPATAGKLPRIAARQFVPPTLEILNMHPKLAMEMTIEAPPDAQITDRSLANLGDPLSKTVNGSAGTGGPQGIGNSHGTGVGDRSGPGAGAGPGGSGLGPVYRPGSGIVSPVLIHSVEPEFSDEARRAKYSGMVTLRADIDATGHPRNIRVVHSMGMGLDDKATAAVAQWLFKPGTRDGKPVAVQAQIEVMFRLL